MFRLIVLLNTLGKHIEKVIGDKLQYQFIVFNFVYPNQLEKLE